MNLIQSVKSKAQTILIIVLATLLAASVISGKYDRDMLSDVREKLLSHVELNKSLSEQNLALAEELRTRPTEFIRITKEVEKEVCNGKVTQGLIDSLPSKKGVSNEQTTQGTADIDDRLPTDLLRLLK